MLLHRGHDDDDDDDDDDSCVVVIEEIYLTSNFSTISREAKPM